MAFLLACMGAGRLRWPSVGCGHRLDHVEHEQLHHNHCCAPCFTYCDIYNTLVTLLTALCVFNMLPAL